MNNNMNPQKQLVIFQRGTITPKDKEKMSKAGFLPIESDIPESVRILIPTHSHITGDDILLSLIEGVQKSFPDAVGKEFSKSLLERIQKNILKK